VIALLGCVRLINRVVVVGEVGMPLIGIAPQESVIPLETATQWPSNERTCKCPFLRRSQMPLADTEGVVSLLQEDLGEESVLGSHDPVVGREPERKLGDSGKTKGVVVAARENASARW
jgi:hypothetical protein